MAAGALSQSGPLAFGNLKRNVGLAGATIRPWQKLSLNVDYEGAITDQNFFRIGLYNYNQVRARARYQASASLLFQANFRFLDNQNPTAGVKLRFAQPGQFAGRVLEAEQRQTCQRDGGVRPLHHVLQHRLPAAAVLYTPTVGIYQDNAHTASSTVDILLPEIVAGHAPKLTAGGTPVHLRGFAVHALLPAAGTPLRAHPQERTMEHRVAMVRLRRAACICMKASGRTCS